MSKTAKRYLRNVAKTAFHAMPLSHLLFEKINRHEVNISVKKIGNSDFSDARHYEHFTRHSSHYSSRNYI